MKETEFVEVPEDERLDHDEPEVDDSNAITAGDADMEMIEKAMEELRGL